MLSRTDLTSIYRKLTRAMLCASGAIAAVAQTAPAAPSTAPRPNVVVILADDMGFSDAGCMGGEINTPNLDRLAEGGVRFTQFYNTARCCPTRASLLTGLYPHQAGVGHMVGSPFPKLPGYRNDLSHEAVTIAEVLKPAGYSTYMTGKWHVTRFENPRAAVKHKHNWPRQRGFDRFYGMITGGGNYFDPAALTRDNTPVTPESDPEYKPERYYFTDAIADESARFVREHKQRQGDGPFFLYVAFTSPHWPLHALEEDVAKYKGKYDAGYEPIRAARFERQKQLGLIDPKWQLSPAPQAWDEVDHDKAWEARCMEVYAAQVDRMDQGIGRVMKALEETGQMDNTLVLFLQDNGACAETVGRNANERRVKSAATQPMKPDEPQGNVFPLHTRAGEPVRDGKEHLPGPETTYTAYGKNWANVSNTPLREYKHWVHEGGISTPLIAHWPKGIQGAGRIVHAPGHLVDLMPTVVELAGASYPTEKDAKPVTPMQGVSLVPVLGGGSTLERGQPIFFEHEGNRAVRDGRWKLVAKGVDGPWELYDIHADRTEMNDLAAKEPERVRAMADQWRKWAEASDVFPLVPWQKKDAKVAAE